MCSVKENELQTQQSFEPVIKSGIAEGKGFVQYVIADKAQAHTGNVAKQFIQVNLLYWVGNRKGINSQEVS